MNGNQMRIKFLQEEYIPLLWQEVRSVKSLQHTEIIEKCKDYGVRLEKGKHEGTEVLRNRLRNKFWQMKKEAHLEISDLVLED